MEKRIAQLEGPAKPTNSRRMPGLKPNAKADRKPAPPKGPRQPRPHGFARARMTPTRRVEHAMDHCPDCGTQLSGGWTHRTREVIELPVVPVQVTEHVYIARTCPACRRRCTPPAVLDGVVLGQQRLGVNVLSLIATLREEGRLPIRSVQWYLDTVHQLRLSVGAIVSAIHRTAQRAQPAVAGDTGPHPRQPSGPRRRNRLASERGQRLRVDLQHPHRTLLPANATSCGGVGAKQSWTRRVVGQALSESFSPGTGQRFLRRLPPLRWPQAAVLGPPAAGHPRPAGPLPQRCPAGPQVGGGPSTLRGSQSLLSSSGPATACRSIGLGVEAAGHLPALPG